MSHQQSNKYAWHYTDKKGAEAIQKSGYIKPSSDTTRDAAWGRGTYVTAKAPNNSTKSLLQNNYDGMVAPRDSGRADYYVKMKQSDLDAYKAPTPGRDVRVVPGGIDLTDKYHVIGQRAGKGLHDK